MTIERRFAPTEFEVRQHATGGAVIRGHAAVFNRLSRNLGGFVEQIDPAAFDKTLADDPDVRALINHDPSHLLGRTRSGTLRLSKDSTGLPYEVDVPDRSDARDLMVSMERGDLDQSSFAFFMVDDDWSTTERDFPLRTVTAASIHNGDVSPVTYPAYEDADSGVADRAFHKLAEVRSLDLDSIRRASADGTLAQLLAGDLPNDEDEQRHPHSSALLIARARLAINA
jgi:HK97 family phage prohead protease